MGVVTALKMDVVTTKSGHQVTGMAVSVCLTPGPVPPGPLPIPYPTMGTTAEGLIATPMRTKIQGAPVLNVGAVVKACHGNEAGALKEIVSLWTAGGTFPIMGAPNVLIERGMTGITNSPGMMNGLFVGIDMSMAASAPGGPDAAGGGDAAAPPAPPAPPAPTAPAVATGSDGSGESSGSDGGGAGGGGAGGGAGGGTKETASDRMLKDFDDETRAAANKSPTLQKQLEQMEKDGWRVKKGPAGGGSYADSSNKTIVMDQNESGAGATGTIAHESGHATYAKDPYVPHDGLTKEQYRDANVRRDLKDEGNAQFNAAQVRQEVMANGGSDTGIPGNGPAYQAVYDDHSSGKLTRDQAVDKMAEQMGNERTSTTNEKYTDYYAKPYDDFYDAANGGKP